MTTNEMTWTKVSAGYYKSSNGFEAIRESDGTGWGLWPTSGPRIAFLGTYKQCREEVASYAPDEQAEVTKTVKARDPNGDLTMAMTQQQIAAENARRTVGRLVAAANELDMRDRITLDVTVWNANRGVNTYHSIVPAAAVTYINRAAERAAEQNVRLTFSIQANLPRLYVTDTATSFL